MLTAILDQYQVLGAKDTPFIEVVAGPSSGPLPCNHYLTNQSYTTY
jgi:hypothetical protein